MYSTSFEVSIAQVRDMIEAMYTVKIQQKVLNIGVL